MGNHEKRKNGFLKPDLVSNLLTILKKKKQGKIMFLKTKRNYQVS